VRAEKDGGSGGALAALQRDVAKFVSRYDPVTTATGSLVVGAYCVMVHGQSPWEALQVSAMASVVGMVSRRRWFLKMMRGAQRTLGLWEVWARVLVLVRCCKGCMDVS